MFVCVKLDVVNSGIETRFLLKTVIYLYISFHYFTILLPVYNIFKHIY